MKTPCYIFDIDGTLANGDHRLPLIRPKDGGKKEWDAYFALCHKDTPIKHMVQLCQRLREHSTILFVSGRRHECWDDTFAWLREHVGPWVLNHHLYVRKPKDFRDDNIIKIEILSEIRSEGYEPIMAFDDRTRVVDAWRAAGVPCLQVAPGDF